MKLSTKLISAAVLMATSSMALAATDTTTIELNVTKDAYVTFTGSLKDPSTQALPAGVIGVDGIAAAATNVGTLGFESNTPGSCDLKITSAKGYNLEHTTPGTFLYATNYNVDYQGSNFNPSSLDTITLTTCNVLDTDLNSAVVVNTPAVTGVVAAGTYSDTLTLVVTTQ